MPFSSLPAALLPCVVVHRSSFVSSKARTLPSLPSPPPYCVLLKGTYVQNPTPSHLIPASCSFSSLLVFTNPPMQQIHRRTKKRSSGLLVICWSCDRSSLWKQNKKVSTPASLTVTYQAVNSIVHHQPTATSWPSKPQDAFTYPLQLLPLVTS